MFRRAERGAANRDTNQNAESLRDYSAALGVFSFVFADALRLTMHGTLVQKALSGSLPFDGEG